MRELNSPRSPHARPGCDDSPKFDASDARECRIHALGSDTASHRQRRSAAATRVSGPRVQQAGPLAPIRSGPARGRGLGGPKPQNEGSLEIVLAGLPLFLNDHLPCPVQPRMLQTCRKIFVIATENNHFWDTRPGRTMGGSDACWGKVVLRADNDIFIHLSFENFKIH